MPKELQAKLYGYPNRESRAGSVLRVSDPGQNRKLDNGLDRHLLDTGSNTEAGNKTAEARIY